MFGNTFIEEHRMAKRERPSDYMVLKTIMVACETESLMGKKPTPRVICQYGKCIKLTPGDIKRVLDKNLHEMFDHLLQI
jgi:hypothetical protein